MAKVAFGFFGQTRVSDVINVWYKKIEKDYDFFMSTWDDKNSQKLNFSFVEICKHNYDNELQKIQEDTPDYCFDKDTKKLIGAHIVGDEASNMIHMLIAFMVMGATISDMKRMIYIHPALPEIVRNAVRNIEMNNKPNK